MTVHNPDRFMVDLRQILSQGRKRIGLLIGAGAPASVRVNDKNEIDEGGQPLIPDVKTLTAMVLNGLKADDQKIISQLVKDLEPNPNIEAVLTRVRQLSRAIGSVQVHGLDSDGYSSLAARMCDEIGNAVSKELPKQPTPFGELVAWIGGTHRQHPVELFTPNYDLLLEECFERARLPYFDGFSGAHRPFFDPASITDDQLPSRWSRLWKLHGSLGWRVDGDTIVRTGDRNTTELIYPDHLKYEQVSRQPYSALFERLRAFLTTPDSLLVCSGFSFSDAHICAVLDEALAANTHTAVLAFQYRALADEAPAVSLALRRPNLSVYARDGAVIFGVKGAWKTGQSPTDEWESIRQTFWQYQSGNAPAEFLLGDFAKLARFFAMAHTTEVQHSTASAPTGGGSVTDSDSSTAIQQIDGHKDA